MTPDPRDIFSLTGPSFLTSVDWENSHHRRSIAASLIKGVYVLERDRQLNRQGPLVQAPPWWQIFNFTLIQILIDDKDYSYFGAIYEFNNKKSPNDPCKGRLGQKPPRYVFAFRGSISKAGNREQDIKLNLSQMSNNLDKSYRYNVALESLFQMIQKVGPEDIWLAGHSLGSSIALLMGKYLVKNTGIHLETYLFNPPFASPPIERIKSDKVKLGLRFANSVLTAGIVYASNGLKIPKAKDNDPFMILSTWIPFLFLNPCDPICSEYIGYFDHREKMESIGAGKIGKLATKHSSLGSIVSIGRSKGSEPLHLIPSAYLTINSSPFQIFKEDHGLMQWWRQDLLFKYKLYQFK